MNNPTTVAMQPPKTAPAIPSPLPVLKRKSFKNWMFRLEMVRLQNLQYTDWTEPNIDINLISGSLPDEVHTEFGIPAGSTVSLMSIIIATINAGIDTVGVEWQDDGNAMVDGVFRMAGGPPAELGGHPGPDIVAELKRRVESRLEPIREKLHELINPCPDLLIQEGVIDPALFEVRSVDNLDGVSDIINREQGINHLCDAPKGAGKTKHVLKPIVAAIRAGIAASHRVTLADNAAATLGCRHYQKTAAGILQTPQWTAYCVNSFIKDEDAVKDAPCVVFDEFHGVMAAIARGPGSGKGMKKPDKVYRIMTDALQASNKTVVMMDANISHKDLQLVAQASQRAGKKLILWMVQATPESRQKAHQEACELGRGGSHRKRVVVMTSEDAINTAVIEAHDQHPGKVIMQGSTSPERIQEAQRIVSALDDENILILPTTRDNPMESAFIADNNSYVERHVVWWVGGSPSISEGISMESWRYHTTIYLSYTSNLKVTFQTVDQMSGRVRAANTICIFINSQADAQWEQIPEEGVQVENIRIAMEENYRLEGEMISIDHLDKYSTFSEWYLRDLEYARIHGKQLLMMKWKEDGYSFEYPTDSIVVDELWDELWMEKDKSSARVKAGEERALELHHGLVDAHEMRGDDKEKLMQEGRLCTREMSYSETKSGITGLLALTPYNRYVRAGGVSEEVYIKQEEKDEEARKVPGSLSFTKDTASDIMAMIRILRFSGAKRDLLFNTIWGIDGSMDFINADRLRKFWPTRQKFSREGFAILNLDPETGEGAVGAMELEEFKDFVVDNLRTAHGCGLMKGIHARFHDVATAGGGTAREMDKVGMKGSMKPINAAKAFMRAHALTLTKKRGEDLWTIHEGRHRWVMQIFQRRAARKTTELFGVPEKESCDVINAPPGETKVIPAVKGMRAKIIREMMEKTGGILPLKPSMMTQLIHDREGKAISPKTAEKRKAAILKDRDLVEEMGLEVRQVRVIQGKLGNGKRDFDLQVLTRKTTGKGALPDRVRVLFEAAEIWVE